MATRLGPSEVRCVSRVQIRTTPRKSFTSLAGIVPERPSAARRVPVLSSGIPVNTHHLPCRMSHFAVATAAAPHAMWQVLLEIQTIHRSLVSRLAQKLPRLTLIMRAQLGALDGMRKAMCDPYAGRSSIA